jgi:GTPase Era involved in 16S rRNA processing
MIDAETTVLPEPMLSEKNGDSEPLRIYTKNKLALAEQLRFVREVFKQGDNEIHFKQCGELMAKLAEDRFTLAVLGQFKRGKSSLMNALIGRDLLPVGALPLTSAITVLRFGPTERLLIYRENVALPFPEEFPVQRLAEFVTEKENPGNCKRVKTAILELPLPFLRRGVEFVDTPGIGSAIEANTVTTLEYLPKCDAALFVTSVDSPLTSMELEFLENIRQHVRKIFFVVNKTDLLGASERQEVLEYVRGTIRKQTGTDDAKIFPLSSRLGLAAKLNDDWSGNLESGLSELENALARFLSGEKASVFLAAIIRRALWLLEQESIEIGMRVRANELPEKILTEKLRTVTAQWENRKAERRQIFERLQQRILSEVDLALMPELLSFIRSEADDFAVEVERRLIPLWWWPLWDVWEKTEQIALTRTCEHILGWLSERVERFSFASDETARADWQRIQSNLADLPVIATNVFGLRHVAKADGEMLPPWRLNVKFELPLTFNFRCRMQLPVWPAILPVGLTRKWLKEHWQKEREQITNKWQGTVALYAADNVRKALDHLADKVESCANEVGIRMMPSFREGKISAEDLSADAEKLDDIRRQLLALRAEISPVHSAAAGVPDKSVETAPLVRLPKQPALSTSAHIIEPAMLSDDLKTRGCPVCEHQSKVAFHFLSQFQFELARDEATQQKFAEELGFCPFHFWQLESVSSPLGASVGFVKLAKHVSKILAAKTQSLSNGENEPQLNFHPTECHVCELLRETETDYLRRLAEWVERPAGRAAYAGSQGVCLRHLNLWLPILSGDETARFVLEATSHRLGQMAEDMQSYSLKTDALRRDLRNSDECDAYVRAITHFAGARNNSIPMNKEAEI